MDYIQIILSVALLLSEGPCPVASNHTSEYYFSCQDQCDNSIHLPCSCHHKCLVYRNCCDDFSHFCPQQSQNGSQQFGFLLRRSISCSVEGFFMIDSCPDEGDDTFNEFGTTMSTRLWLFLKSIDALPSTLITDNSSTTQLPFFSSDNSQSSTPPYQSNIVDFKTVWKNRPVLDDFTGFLFSDYDKYICNAVPNSHPVFWEIQLGLESLKMFEHANVFETQVDWTSVRYQQPRSVGSAPVGVQCIPISISTCPDITKYSHPETYKLCRISTNYVKDLDLIFSNKDCNTCWNTKRRRLEIVEDFTSPKLTSVFSILIAMSQNNVVIIKPLEEKTQEAAIWREINCGLGPEQDVETERIRCDMRECADNAVRTLDDTCVDGKYVTLALGHAGFPLDSHVKIMLKEFLHCWITPQFGYDAIDARDIDLLPVTYYENILNETLDVITVAVTSRDPSMSLSRPEHIQSLDYLNKALTFYRMDRDDPSRGHHFPDQRNRHIRQILQNDAKLARFLNRSMAYDSFSEPSSSSTLNLNQSQLLKTENPALYYSIFPQGKPVVVENIFYTTCICEKTRNQSCAMVCWQTPLFRRDIDSIAHFLESQCFEMFETSASDGRLVSTAPILWTVLCFILRSLRL